MAMWKSWESFSLCHWDLINSQTSSGKSSLPVSSWETRGGISYQTQREKSCREDNFTRSKDLPTKTLPPPWDLTGRCPRHKYPDLTFLPPSKLLSELLSLAESKGSQRAQESRMCPIQLKLWIGEQGEGGPRGTHEDFIGTEWVKLAQLQYYKSGWPLFISQSILSPTR